jgi:ribose transport system ATP-binding protein
MLSKKTRMANSGVTAAVTVRGLTDGSTVPFDFDIREGETLGVTGLIGSGFAALPYLLYGARRGSGTITVGGNAAKIGSMTPLTAQQMGIAFLPGDRLGAAGIGSLSVTDNITLPVLDSLLKPYGLDRPAMTREAARLAQIYDVRPQNPHLPLGSLSGGNQQKVLLAKWLQIKPKLLMLDARVSKSSKRWTGRRQMARPFSVPLRTTNNSNRSATASSSFHAAVP